MYNPSLNQYFPHPLSDKYRIILQLDGPYLKYRDIPTSRNPHDLGGYGSKDAFYINNDWSTVYDIVEDDGLIMAVENGHKEPLWGEKITLYSTFSHLRTIPWERNIPNKFAFFRNRFWRIKSWYYCQEYDNNITYPLMRDGIWDEITRFWGRGYYLAMPRWITETKCFAPKSQKMDRRLWKWLDGILISSDPWADLWILSDYLEENEIDLGLVDLIRQCLYKCHNFKPNIFMNSRIKARWNYNHTFDNFKLRVAHFVGDFVE